MKTTVKFFILFLAVNLITLMAPQKTIAQVSINFQIFYDNLSPYGHWIDYPDYGYVWVPRVSRNFTPYRSNGHWVFTNVGWTWVSNYSWGWAPFHYGRWFYTRHYGWMWVPDYEWGPGWVIWRQSDDYYGWAPIGPGISFSIAYSSGYNLPYNQWTFVRDRDFGRTNIYNYYIPSSNNPTIINNSRIINNIQRDNSGRVSYNAGPDRTEVQRRTGNKISQVTIRERNKPGQNLSKDEFQIYRPRLEKNNSAGRKPAPSKVVRLEDIKPETQRNTKTQQDRLNQPARQQQRNEQQTRQQQERQQRNDQQSRQQQIEQRRDDQQARQHQERQQRNEQQARQQQMEQQRIEQQARQQQAQQQRNEQQARQQQMEQHHNDQQNRQQHIPQQRNDQQPKQHRQKN